MIINKRIQFGWSHGVQNNQLEKAKHQKINCTKKLSHLLIISKLQPERSNQEKGFIISSIK